MTKTLIRGVWFGDVSDVLATFQHAYASAQPLTDTEVTLIRAWTTAVDPPTVKSAFNTIGALVRFLRAAQSLDWSLDPDRLFAPRNVEWYCAKILTTSYDEVRATERSRLRAVAKAVSVHTRPPTNAAKYPKRTPKSPYDEACIIDYIRISRFQSTRYRTRIFQAHLALCVGAGLRATEMSLIEGSHVRQEDGYALVDVPGPAARTVPVRRDFESMLLGLADTVSRGPLVGRQHKGVRPIHQGLKAAIEIPDWLPPLMTSRLRATWIVWCLNNGVNLVSLMHAAGTRTLDIGSWTPYMAPRPDTEVERAFFAGAAA